MFSNFVKRWLNSGVRETKQGVTKRKRIAGSSATL
jgi:hypothetical protein